MPANPDVFHLIIQDAERDCVLLHASQHVKAAYLKPWQEYADMETLLRIFNLAGDTAPLHLALLYHRCILPRMDVQWEMENMLPYYLRMSLKDGK